jgi:RecB family exonuclease
VVSGAIDDVWVDPKGQLMIVDYKSTSKDEKIEVLDKDWHEGYKQQMEVYQWLFRQNGFKVSDTGYFVYANAGKDKKAFDGVLEFEVTLVPHVGDDSWVEKTILNIKKCLDGEILPEAGEGCDYCVYREMVGKKLQAFGKKPRTGNGTLGI